MPPPHPAADFAPRIPLDGPWHILPDPMDRGRRDRWFEAPPADGWRPIGVPSAWQSVVAEDEADVCWYRRDLPPLDTRPGRRHWLHIAAAATDTQAWVGGQEVGESSGDWAPFEFELPVALPDAAGRGASGPPVLLRIDRRRPDPPRWIDGAPVQSGHITKGFHDITSMQHAGLWQSAAVRTTGPAAIRPGGIIIQPDATTGEVTITIDLHDTPHGAPSARAIVEVEESGVRGQGSGVRGQESGVRSPIQSTAAAAQRSGTQPRRGDQSLAPGAASESEPARGSDPLNTPEPRRGEGGAPCNTIARATSTFDAARATLTLNIPSPQLWSPEAPNLYTAHIKIESGGELSDQATIRFGFRTVKSGGENNTRILLNNQPIFLRGMLDWGHEPETGAPAPSPDTVRARFQRLRAMGFNLVCICMWYPPQWFYDIADETGMLIWQEHPVWKSPMRPELNDAYKAQFERFFRMDVNHPSVVIVSGSCEHERIDPDLARWWWGRARELMPDRLLQVQTAFLEWGESDRSDLHDEHTYETTGRWVQYQEDLEAELATRSPKPFVMGESILYTNFPPVREIRERYSDTLPWWAPLRMHELEQVARAIEARFGAEAFARFLEDNRDWHLAGRKRQMEIFRQRATHAGLVMNHLRDVPLCPCGFQDDLGRWLFQPEETRPWLAEAALLLRTSGHLRGVEGGQELTCDIGLSNFSARALAGTVRVEIQASADADARTIGASIEASPGDIAFTPLVIPLTEVEAPTPLDIRATLKGAEPNTWRIWLFPTRSAPNTTSPSVPSSVSSVDSSSPAVIAPVEPFTEAERQLTFEESKYSSGWGLSRMTWRPRLPDPAAMLPGARRWEGDGPNGPDGHDGRGRPIVTARLTRSLCEALEGGARVLLLATNAAGSPPTKTVNMWGQSPLIPPLGPMRDPALRSATLDLLDHDLTRRHMRAVPTGDLALADSVDPFIRLVYLHDRPRGLPVYDSLFAARVGDGMLMVSTLDHAEAAGLALLDAMIAWLSGADLPQSRLDQAIAREWAAGANAT